MGRGPRTDRWIWLSAVGAPVLCLFAANLALPPTVVFLVGLIGFAALFSWVVRSRRPSHHLGEEAQAIAETAIVFPMILVCVLGFYQLTLVVHANAVVRSAAFFAARAATVWIPQDTTLEGPEELEWYEGSRKADEILQAARLSLVPISQLLEVAGPGLPGYASSKASAHRTLAHDAMADLGSGFPADFYSSRFGYAVVATDVEIAYEGEDGTSVTEGDSMYFDRFEDIGVTVLYEYYLGVPLVNQLFAGFSHDAVMAGSECSTDFFTVRIADTCTLPLETAFEIDEVAP